MGDGQNLAAEKILTLVVLVDLVTSCCNVFVKDGCLLDIQRFVELSLLLFLAQRAQIGDDFDEGAPLQRSVTWLEQNTKIFLLTLIY